MKRFSRELCVASAIVLPDTVARGALTAIMWFWTPASPFEVFPSAERGCEWALDQLERASLALPAPRGRIVREISRALEPPTSER